MPNKKNEPKTSSSRPIFHRIGEVREAQEISHRTLRRRLGENRFTTEEVRGFDNPTCDITLTLFYEIADALEVPAAELLPEHANPPMGEAVHQRAAFVQLMKTAKSIQDNAQRNDPESVERGRLHALDVIRRLIEIDPNLNSGVTTIDLAALRKKISEEGAAPSEEDD